MASWEKPPKLRDDLVIAEQETGGQKFIVLKDPITRRYFRVREPEYFILRQFDGINDFEDVSKKFREKFSLDVSADDIENFASKVESLYFFEGSRAEYEISSGRYKGGEKKSLFSRILFIKLKAFNPDRILKALLPPLRFLFQPWSVLLMIIFVLAGFYTYSINYEGFRFTPGELFNIGSILIIFISLALIILIHEFAHALTCHYHGGQVQEMGFLLLYFQICFYSNLSDSWLFKKKSARLAVLWSGLFFQMVIFALAVFAWRVTVIDTLPNKIFWLTANVCFLMLLFNVNPLIKLDGYYLLSEILDLPNLRSRSFEYLKDRFKSFIGLTVSEPESTRRERRVFVAYTLLAGIYSVLLIGYVTSIVYRFLVNNLSGWGFILFLILVAVIFKNPVISFGKFFAGRDVMKVLTTKPGNIIIGGIIVILLALILFFIPFPRQAGGPVVVQPIAEFSVTLLSEQGLLELKMRQGGRDRHFSTEHIQLNTGDLAVLRLTPLVQEGVEVAQGDTLAAIASNQVSTSLMAERSELERLKGELALANSPPKPEEVEKAESEVNAARIYAEQLERDIQRDKSLYEKKLISKQELEKSQSAYDLAKSDLLEAEARLRLLKAPPKKEEITIIESKIAAQNAKIEYLITQEAAQALTTPISGRLIELYRNGLLFKVADLSWAEVAVPVSDLYLDYIEPNAKVNLRLRSFPDRLFEGYVSHISFSANEKSQLDSPAKFAVYGVLNNDEDILKDGMSGYAKIECGKASLASLIFERVKSFIRVEFWSWW